MVPVSVTFEVATEEDIETAFMDTACWESDGSCTDEVLAPSASSKEVDGVDMLDLPLYMIPEAILKFVSRLFCTLCPLSMLWVMTWPA